MVQCLVLFFIKTHNGFAGEKMKKEKTIGTIIIWAGVIIASIIILNGTEYLSKIFPILFAGTFSNLLVIGALNENKNKI